MPVENKSLKDSVNFSHFGQLFCSTALLWKLFSVIALRIIFLSTYPMEATLVHEDTSLVFTGTCHSSPFPLTFLFWNEEGKRKRYPSVFRGLLAKASRTAFYNCYIIDTPIVYTWTTELKFHRCQRQRGFTPALISGSLCLFPKLRMLRPGVPSNNYGYHFRAETKTQ